MTLARLRARSDWRRHGRGYAAVAVVFGALAGLSLAAVAGAQRTQSSFATYLASTRPADTRTFTAIADPQVGMTQGYVPARNELVGRLPGVRAWADVVIFNANMNLLKPARLYPAPGQSPPTIQGSTNGEFTRLDRVTVVAGHPFTRGHPDEVVMNASAARELRLGLGGTMRIAFFSDAENLSSAANPPPVAVVTLRVVGIVVINSDVVTDDIETLGGSAVIMSPELTRRLAPCCAFASGVAVRVAGGDAGVRRFAAESRRVLPDLSAVGGGGTGSVVTATDQRAARALRPVSSALYVFGVVAGLAALLVAAQLLTRLRRNGAVDRRVLRALGASRAERAIDAAALPAISVVLGVVVALAVATALSPLAPIGEVRAVYPNPGVHFDAVTLLLGSAAALGVLLGLVLLDVRREGRRAQHRRWRPASRVAARAASSGLAAPGVEGLRLALDPGGPDAGVPVRSAIVGAVAAVAILATTLTFGASLDRLVSHPALYGWNWSAMMLGGYGAEEDLPGPQATAALDHDRLVAAWSGVYFKGLSVDGVRVPAIGVTPGAHVAPPILSGHGVDGPGQVVLGADTLALLRVHLGSTLSVSVRGSAPIRLRVVGTAVLPAVGNGGGGAGSHLEMASGALVPYTLIPPKLRNLQGNPIPGPQAILLRYRPDVSLAAERADINRLGKILDTVKGDRGAYGGTVALLRPAEIVNYRSSTSIPTALAALTTAGALSALGLTLASSVRRRRRDLAILRVVGFTRSQLVATVAAQATTVALIGIVVGMPIGALAGRALWGLFAGQVHVVDSPALPFATLAYVALAALALANAAALLPARAAARVPAALALRSE